MLSSAYSDYLNCYTHCRFIYAAAKYDTVYFKDMHTLICNEEYIQSIEKHYVSGVHHH